MIGKKTLESKKTKLKFKHNVEIEIENLHMPAKKVKDLIKKHLINKMIKELQYLKSFLEKEDIDTIEKLKAILEGDDYDKRQGVHKEQNGQQPSCEASIQQT